MDVTKYVSFHYFSESKEISYIIMGKLYKKIPAYGRHRISRPMRIVGLIQFWRVCMIYLEEKK